MILLPLFTATALLHAAAPLRVAYEPLLGGPDVAALDEVARRALADIPGVALTPASQSDAAFGACERQGDCLGKAARQLRLDLVITGMAGLERDAWLVRLVAVDRDGAVVREVTGRWSTESGDLRHAARSLLQRLLVPERNAGSVEIAPEGGSFAGASLLLDGKWLDPARLDGVQGIAQGGHVLRVVTPQRPIELLFAMPPRGHVRIWVNLASGEARVVPASVPMSPAGNAPPSDVPRAAPAFAEPNLAPPERSREQVETVAPFFTPVRIGGTALAGVGAVLLGVGIAEGVRSSSDARAADAASPGGVVQPQDAARVADLRDHSVSERNLATALYLSSAVAVATGAVLFVIGAPPSSEGAVAGGGAAGAPTLAF